MIYGNITCCGLQVSSQRRNLPSEYEADDNQHENHNDQSDAGDDTGPDVNEGVGAAATFVRDHSAPDGAASTTHSVDARHFLGHGSVHLADRLDLEYRERLKRGAELSLIPKIQ